MPRGPQKRSETTRAALLATARHLFCEQGYAGVTADELVAGAGLTRGALHHHFGDKQGLFKQVVLQIEGEITDEIVTAMAPHGPVADRMLVAVDTFLVACTRKELVRVALLDAPTVLGWSEWRAIEGEHGLRLITELVEEGMATGVLTRLPVAALAQVLLGSLTESALMIAHAEDKAAMREQVQETLGTLLSGLLAE